MTFKGETWHWYDKSGAGRKDDGYYGKLQKARKKANKAKWCRQGIEHNYQPHDKYDWVKDGIARYGFSVPWVLCFAKCVACGREKIWSVDNPKHRPAERERRWRKMQLRMQGLMEGQLNSDLVNIDEKKDTN